MENGRGESSPYFSWVHVTSGECPSRRLYFILNLKSPNLNATERGEVRELAHLNAGAILYFYCILQNKCHPSEVQTFQ